jgi:hypothetical protein
MASDQVKRKLPAILAADIAGHSRLMGADEIGTIADVLRFRFASGTEHAECCLPKKILWSCSTRKRLIGLARSEPECDPPRYGTRTRFYRVVLISIGSSFPTA